MKNYLQFIIMIFITLVSTSITFADFLAKGYITNDAGKKCWYKQTVKNSSTYFHKSLTSNIHILRFDDPKCMADSGLGHGVNKMMINNIITRSYSHADAAFLTHDDELFNGSLLQIKGQCIQSKTYKSIGVTVDYQIKNKSIINVIHSSSAGGCINK